MKRFRFIPFWHLTLWGFLFQRPHGALQVNHACDEYHNAGWYVIVPLIGEFVLFRKDYDTSGPLHIYAYSPEGGWVGHFDPDCECCVEISEEI